SALDAYRLLRLAIADPDPVIVLEPKARYWWKETGGLVSDGPRIGDARILRDGETVTLLAYGAMVARVLDAAAILAEEAITARVVHLRTRSPFDHSPPERCAR